MAMAESGQLTLLHFFPPKQRESKRLIPRKRSTRTVSTQFTLLDYYQRETEEPLIERLNAKEEKQIGEWVQHVDHKQIRFSPIVMSVEKRCKGWTKRVRCLVDEIDRQKTSTEFSRLRREMKLLQHLKHLRRPLTEKRKRIKAHVTSCILQQNLTPTHF